MHLVSQSGYPDACQQACIAMLSGKTIEEVIAECGTDKRLSYETRRSVLNRYGVILEQWAYAIEAFGANAIGALMQKHETLWLGVFSAKDIRTGHAVLLHKSELYDPAFGMNPSWPWHWYIGIATPVTQWGGRE